MRRKYRPLRKKKDSDMFQTLHYMLMNAERRVRSQISLAKKRKVIGAVISFLIDDVSCHSDVLPFLVTDWKEVKIRREMCNELTCVLQ